MKKFLVTALLSLSPIQASADPTQSTTTIAVYFSPKGGATTASVREIDGVM